jgi:hypothetical protein
MRHGFGWPLKVGDVSVAHWNASDRGADWAKRWGAHDMTCALKLLWEFPHGAPDWVPKENFLLTNEDATKVTTHKLLGVVRAVIRNGVMLSVLSLAAPLSGCALSTDIARQAACGNPFDAKSAQCISIASIDPNATSQIASVFSAALIATNNNVLDGPGSSTDAAVIQATVATTGSPMAIDVGCTVSLTGGGAPASSFTSAILDVYMDGLSIGSAKWDGTNLANYGGGSSPPALQVTLSTTNIPPAGVHTYTLHAHVAGTGSVWSCTINCVNNFLKIREIKR